MKQTNILLVDDSEGDVYLILEAFRDSGYKDKVTVLSDGAKAFAFLAKQGDYERSPVPDLILLDINLPKKSGHEVLQFIKNGDLRHVPVIMLSTSSSELDINRAYRNQANCFITKPVETDSFGAMVKGLEHFWLSIVKLPVHQIADNGKIVSLAENTCR